MAKQKEIEKTIKLERKIARLYKKMNKYKGEIMKIDEKIITMKRRKK